MDITRVKFSELYDSCETAHEILLLLAGVRYGMNLPEGNRVLIGQTIDKEMERIAEVISGE